MAKQILLVFPDVDTEDLIHGLVKKKLTEDSADRQAPVQTCERTEAEAKRHLETRRYDLLITADCIPPDRSSPLIEEEMLGVDLLSFAKAVQPDLPCIVYTKAWTPRLSAEITKLARCDLVVAGEYLEETLTACLDRIIERPTDEGGTTRAKRFQSDVVDVEIFLRECGVCSYHIRKQGSHRFDNIIMEEEEFKALLDESDELEELTYEKWKAKLWKIGARLVEDLKSSHRFSQDFYAVTQADIRKCRFIFDIDKRFHPIALEAIVDKDADDFWMLEAPVIRRVRLESPIRVERDVKDAPINCLILESAIDGPVEKVSRHFRPLDNVPKEAEWLQQFLHCEHDDKPTVPVGEVLRIDEDAATRRGTSFEAYVQEVLQERGPWHIVHYAGHSFYDQDRNRGYVFFPAPPGGKLTPREVDIWDFARWLRDNKVRIVYMSSCHSSESNIVFELARNYVQAIVGFRWDVPDDRAAEHARAFYTSLLTGSEPMRIEHAFLKARQETYRSGKTDKTWAAPMLIHQVWD